MLQFVLVFPMIYFITKKLKFNGVILFFVLTGLWEALLYLLNVSNLIYSHLIPRYFSLIAFGVFIAFSDNKLSRRILVLIFLTGFSWQTFLCYFSLNPPYFMNYAWARVNYLSSLMVIPIMYILIRHMNIFNVNMHLLECLGRASYNVYLTQMVIYAYGVGFIYKYVKDGYLQLLVIIALCCIFGYIFYLIENKTTKKLISILF